MYSNHKLTRIFFASFEFAEAQSFYAPPRRSAAMRIFSRRPRRAFSIPLADVPWPVLWQTLGALETLSLRQLYLAHPRFARNILVMNRQYMRNHRVSLQRNWKNSLRFTSASTRRALRSSSSRRMMMKRRNGLTRSRFRKKNSGAAKNDTF